MAITYEPISTTTLTSSSGSVTFSSIPSTYTDLRIVFTANSTGAADYAVYLRFNGDSGGNYITQVMRSYNSTIATANMAESGISLYSGSMGINPVRGMWLIDVVNYQSAKYKCALFQMANAKTTNTGILTLGTGRWASTSAITSLSLNAGGTSFEVNSKFTLFGIKAA